MLESKRSGAGQGPLHTVVEIAMWPGVSHLTSLQNSAAHHWLVVPEMPFIDGSASALGTSSPEGEAVTALATSGTD